MHDSEIRIPSNELTPLDRDRHGGGIATYVAYHLPFTVSLSASCPFVSSIAELNNKP